MKLYIGLDMGWKSFRYEVRDHHCLKVEAGGGAATPDGLRRVLERYANRGSVQVAYEGGPQLHWVAAEVEGLGMASYPFHAAAFHLNVKSKNKTDKKDAERIAKAASKDNLPRRLVVSSDAERTLRDLLRERKRFQKLIVQCGNTLRAYAIQLGFELDVTSLCQSVAHWERGVSRLAGSRYESAAQRLYCVVLALFQGLEQVEEAIQDEGNAANWREARKRLESIPGVGYWTAMGLLAWCGPRAERFASSRHAASYFGLTGRVYESGAVSRNGHITKCGPPLVRSLLVQAAWAFLRSQAGRSSRWGQWFCRRTAKSVHQRKKSIVGLARKIVTAAVACLQNETEWNPDVLHGLSNAQTA